VTTGAVHRKKRRESTLHLAAVHAKCANCSKRRNAANALYSKFYHKHQSVFHEPIIQGGPEKYTTVELSLSRIMAHTKIGTD